MNQPAGHSPGTVEQHPLQAIGMMLGAVFLFSLMDVAFKFLVEDYHSLQVVFFRCVMSSPLYVVWILYRDRSLFKTAYPGGHLLRAVIGLIMLFSVGECFRAMPLADAYAIFFATPLVITLLSGPVLGEAAGPVRTIAALLGFAGVLAVLRPGGASLLSYGAVMGFIGMLSYAATSLLLRKLGHKDATVTIAFMFVTLVGIGSGLLAIPYWKPLDPSHWPLLLLLGISGTIAQLLLTAAYRRASPAVVAPFDYTHMLWAALFGFTFWGHVPGTRTWVGTAIVVLSGLLIIYREQRQRVQQLQRASPRA